MFAFCLLENTDVYVVFILKYLLSLKEAILLNKKCV